MKGQTVKVRLKIVPEEYPNHDGYWISRRVPGWTIHGRRVREIWRNLEPFIPDGFQMVDYRRPYRRKRPKNYRVPPNKKLQRKV